MKIAISVGEHSADIHGANLVREIKKINPNVDFFGFGGDLMRNAGVDIEYDLTKMAIMGFVEPIKKYFFAKRLLFNFVERLKTEKPDLLVLIDYPGFNLMLAKEVHKLNIPVYYYIAPQVWAWGSKRIEKIKIYIKKIIVILPFEKEIYENVGIEAHYVGNPIVDVVKITASKDEFIKQIGLDPNFKTIGIFPGSREQEVRKLLPEMLEIIKGIRKRMEKVQFIIVLSESITLDQKIIGLPRADISVLAMTNNGLKIVRGRQYDVMNVSDLIIVASGTVALEASIMKTPTIVMYKLNWLSYWLARAIVKIKYISLVNIIANKKIISEYVQNFKISDIINESITLLENPKLRDAMKMEIVKVAETLGEKGVSKKVAEIILK